MEPKSGNDSAMKRRPTMTKERKTTLFQVKSEAKNLNYLIFLVVRLRFNNTRFF